MSHPAVESLKQQVHAIIQTEDSDAWETFLAQWRQICHFISQQVITELGLFLTQIIKISQQNPSQQYMAYALRQMLVSQNTVLAASASAPAPIESNAAHQQIKISLENPPPPPSLERPNMPSNYQQARQAISGDPFFPSYYFLAYQYLGRELQQASQPPNTNHTFEQQFVAITNEQGQVNLACLLLADLIYLFDSAYAYIALATRLSHEERPCANCKTIFADKLPIYLTKFPNHDSDFLPGIMAIIVLSKASLPKTYIDLAIALLSTFLSKYSFALRHYTARQEQHFKFIKLCITRLCGKIEARDFAAQAPEQQIMLLQLYGERLHMPEPGTTEYDKYIFQLLEDAGDTAGSPTAGSSRAGAPSLDFTNLMDDVLST
tara:strand:- start:54359 stop:55489 length:1131 start_codon:yes stop_codon:yes gene_type:complete